MPHVVVGIISRDRGGEPEYFLVSSRKDYGTSFGAYYPPGGHMEDGEDERTTLIREIREELGVRANPLEKVAEGPGDVEGITVSWWTCEIPTTKMRISDTELSRVGWFTRSEMAQLTLWPATKAVFDAYIFPVA